MRPVCRFTATGNSEPANCPPDCRWRGAEVGAGEWLFRRPGTRKRRSWRKLHIRIDADSGEIVTDLTDKDVDDALHVAPLLDQLAGAPARFMGDGAYDRACVLEGVLARNPNAKFIVPPCKGAVTGPTAATSPKPARPTCSRRRCARADELAKDRPGYNRRSKVEASDRSLQARHREYLEVAR